jgi:hypothetical protein
MSSDLIAQITRSFASVSSEQFERICRDALVSLGFFNVVLRGQHRERDRGRDIEANYLRMLPDGRTQVMERWFFECKHKRAPIPVSDLVDKVGWASAEHVDYLAVMSTSALTVDATDYLRLQSEKSRLKICNWSGDTLSTLFARCPTVVTSHFSHLSSEFIAESGSRERIEMAKRMLSVLDITYTETGSSKYKLLEEVLRRCIEKEDVRYLDVHSGESSSNIIYILTANAKGLASEGEIVSALATLLQNGPRDNRTWALARHLRKTDDERGYRPIRAVLVGPKESGKTALIYALQVHCLSDPRFRFPEASFKEFPRLYEMTLSIEAKSVPLTPFLSCHRMDILKQQWLRRKPVTLLLWDSPGELMHNLPEIEHCGLHPGDLILVTFDCSNPSLWSDGQFTRNKEYLDTLTWAKEAGYRVIPTLTKVDSATHDMREHWVREIRMYFDEPVLETSASHKTGLDNFVEILVQHVG